MNSLLQITIRWTVYLFVYHCDISSFYNSVPLNVENWRYQLYWWCENLDVERPPLQMVIKTLIYGERPNGSLAE